MAGYDTGGGRHIAESGIQATAYRKDRLMAKKPNYGQERRDRDRIKAAKKAEKQNAKAEKSERAKPVEDNEVKEAEAK
ncbi:hypothetical protein MAXJ12_35389 [Mesorhizobium alhagi CCNWXJ12-2]|jgi:hypothetical protein|uniref:Uncharacterized protein n=2 Tax=Allomesorhizobium alhagi TaxID=475067 RepID=H0I3L3_9HYPH|nr:hypothetical protein MAXJ12_35389 [Mesorhizobium alhagi CCNWXJ12-2]